MDQRVLVIGATGRAGSEVVKLLQKEKTHIRAAVRDIEKGKKLFGEEIEYVYFDLKKSESIPPALEGVKKLFLVRPADLGAKKIYPAIDAAKAAGVEQIVFLSVMSVDKNPMLPHRKIEDYIKAAGIPFTFLRATFFMQNLNTNHREGIKQLDQILLPAGKGKTSLIDVRDIAAIAVKAMQEDEHKNKAYLLTGNDLVDYYEVADIFTEVLERKITYPNPSILKFLREMRALGSSLVISLVMAFLYTSVRFGFAAIVSKDTEKVLGRTPTTVKKYAEDYKKYWM